MFEPISVLLQFGFLAVLYLFLLWVVRSTAKDLTVSRDSQADDFRSQVHRARSREDEKPRASGRLVVIKGKGLKRDAAFDLGDGLMLGRSSSCQIRLDDGYASHRHTRVFAQGAKIYVQDLDSTNGTFVNGKQVKGQVQLKPRDLIRIGDTELRLEQ